MIILESVGGGGQPDTVTRDLTSHDTLIKDLSTLSSLTILLNILQAASEKYDNTGDCPPVGW